METPWLPHLKNKWGYNTTTPTPRIDAYDSTWSRLSLTIDSDNEET